MLFLAHGVLVCVRCVANARLISPCNNLLWYLSQPRRQTIAYFWMSFPCFCPHAQNTTEKKKLSMPCFHLDNYYFQGEAHEPTKCLWVVFSKMKNLMYSLIPRRVPTIQRTKDGPGNIAVAIGTSLQFWWIGSRPELRV